MKKTLFKIAQNNFQIKQVESEISALLDFLSDKKIKNFAEIGTHYGGTFFMFLKSFEKGGIKISIDLPGGKWGGLTAAEISERNKKLQIESDNEICFISGNSHDAKIVDQCEAALCRRFLGSKKLDLLFIDGDHSYYGARTDYMLYKKFVKNGGYIVFHDIKKSEFHAVQNCYVSEFWDQIEVETDHTREFSDSSESFGGIGLIKKNTMYESLPDIKTEIHQIYYNEATKKMLQPLFTPYFNKKFSPYFENQVLIDLCDNGLIDKKNDYVGITSPRISEKTFFTDAELLGEVAKHNGRPDCFIYSNYNNQFETEFWKNTFLESQEIAGIIDKTSILPFKIKDTKDIWKNCYCNYFIIRPELMIEYINTVLKAIINYFNVTDLGLGHTAEDNLLRILINREYKHRKDTGVKYTISVFFIEGLFGSWLASRKDIVCKTIVSKNKEHISVDAKNQKFVKSLSAK
ncbi:MAG: class I SAM-dependent methyltransferase [Candidatus Babeliaceae bacterium]|jgi:cephalosporin hydroxylase